MRKEMLKGMATAIKKAASASGDSCCAWIFHQPKAPKK
jgi:cyclic lactone autoinducer peptide